jgi:hypothetical protein
MQVLEKHNLPEFVEGLLYLLRRHGSVTTQFRKVLASCSIGLRTHFDDAHCATSVCSPKS